MPDVWLVVHETVTEMGDGTLYPCASVLGAFSSLEAAEVEVTRKEKQTGCHGEYAIETVPLNKSV